MDATLVTNDAPAFCKGEYLTDDEAARRERMDWQRGFAIAGCVVVNEVLRKESAGG
jgi:hypothetical protein